jgi:CRISPR-associated protein Cas1
MATLYVTQPGATVRNQAEYLVVTHNDAGEDGESKVGRQKVLLKVAPHRLEVVALVGRVHVTAAAVQFCLDRGIAVAWFARHGGFRGRLTPAMPRSADLRLLQYAAWQDTAYRLVQARNVIVAKLINGAHFLQQIQSNYPNLPHVASGIAELKALSVRLREAANRDELLGFEGMAARVYFQAYGAAFRSEISFSGRNRCPPADPANALLSFGYVLLGNLLAGMVEARGLDPAIGFFHELQPGKASLALDLLEEFRHPLVDRFVLRVCNLRMLQPAMFEADPERPGGVRLTREGLKQFFYRWEEFLLRPLPEMNSGEKIAAMPLLHRQVDRMAADLRGQSPYQPFAYGA